jgi:hypothetical protein
MNIKDLKRKILLAISKTENYNVIVSFITVDLKKYRTIHSEGKAIHEFLLLLETHYELREDENRQEVAIELMNRMVGYCAKTDAIMFDDINDYIPNVD